MHAGQRVRGTVLQTRPRVKEAKDRGVCWREREHGPRVGREAGQVNRKGWAGPNEQNRVVLGEGTRGVRRKRHLGQGLIRGLWSWIAAGERARDARSSLINRFASGELFI